MPDKEGKNKQRHTMDQEQATARTRTNTGILAAPE
jgi:hypothetical protein